MNSCDLCLENLSAYLDSELSNADKQAFEQHIQTCETCAGELALMKTILSSSSELEEDLPDGFEASLHKRLETAKEEAAVKRKRLVNIRLFSQIAAGFVLVIALGLLVRSGLFSTNDSSAPGQAATAPMMAADTSNKVAASEPAQGTALTTSAPAGATPPTASDYQADSALTASMKSPEAAENFGFMTDVGPLQSQEKVVMVPDDSMFSLAATRSMNRLEGFDTWIRIQTADIAKALDAITAIERKLDNGADSNCDNLDSANQKYASATEQPVEVKLYYSNDELWQQFLGEMQGVFPDMIIESVEAQEEQEYIRVVLQKVD
ncbi:MAG: zf-HC2 domain-containing protein [Thermoclostridium sp.]|nr:zf-HC2 domain-containing protein [Thermoclostridium sp.]